MSNEFYKRGVQYDAQHAHMTQDIGFYKEIARDVGGPILELACGTGRILQRLAEDGHQVTGMDIEESMLTVARKKAPSTEILLGDMRRFGIGRKFRLILIAFNSIGLLLNREQVEQCFRCVREHLTEEGTFVLALFNPTVESLIRRKEEREISRYPDPESDNEVVVTAKATYDSATQVLTSNWHYVIGEKEFDNRLHQRIFYPQELEALLNYAGYDIHEKYGNFDMSPFTSDSPHQIYLSG